MSSELIGTLMIAVMLIAIFVGFPISFTLIFLGLAFGYWGFGDLVFYLMTLQFNSVMLEQALAAVPLFVFMGIMMEQAGLMERLFRSVQLMLASTRGSLYIAVLFVSTIFAAATGIVGASVTILGIMAARTMNRSGYDVRLAAGTITAGGTLGILIPPSIMLVVLGPVLEVPVTDLFAAAIVPGLLLAFLYTAYSLVRCWLDPELGPPLPKEEHPESVAVVVREFTQGLVPPAALVGFALGSILFGWATPTEGAACGAFGALVLTVAYGKLTAKRFSDALIKTLEISVLILFLVAASNFFGAVFSRLGTPTMLTNMLLDWELTQIQVLLIVMALIFLLGLAARVGAHRPHHRAYPHPPSRQDGDQPHLVRDPGGGESPDRMALAAGGVVGLFPEGGGPGVGSQGHLRRHDAVHADPAHRACRSPLVPAARPLAPLPDLRMIPG